MARHELHTESAPIEQLPPIVTDSLDREPEVIFADRIESNDYLDALAFNEDAVTIRIEPGIEENAPQFHPCWVNGKGAEVLVNGRWLEFKHFPVAEVLTTKRKYLEVLLRSKRNSIITHIVEQPGRDPINEVRRPTSATMAISIIHDPSPRAAAWMTELRRRNW